MDYISSLIIDKFSFVKVSSISIWLKSLSSILKIAVKAISIHFEPILLSMSGMGWIWDLKGRGWWYYQQLHHNLPDSDWTDPLERVLWREGQNKCWLHHLQINGKSDQQRINRQPIARPPSHSKSRQYYLHLRTQEQQICLGQGRDCGYVLLLVMRTKQEKTVWMCTSLESGKHVI